MELAHGVLEVLVNALTAGGTPGDREGGAGGGEGRGGDAAGAGAGADEGRGGRGARAPPGSSGPGAANADALARKPANVELLLSLLDESDFYVRYHTVQLLTALSATNARQLQARPGGFCHSTQYRYDKVRKTS